jgi:hypothetical protein
MPSAYKYSAIGRNWPPNTWSQIATRLLHCARHPPKRRQAAGKVARANCRGRRRRIAAAPLRAWRCCKVRSLMELLQLNWSAPTAPLTRSACILLLPHVLFTSPGESPANSAMNMSFALVNQGPSRKALVILLVDAILAPTSDFLWYEMVWMQSRLRSMVWNWFGRDLGSILWYATSLDACWLHAVEPYRRSYTCNVLHAYTLLTSPTAK